MPYRISHKTTYQYHTPVALGTHLVRLRPRSNGWQTCDSWGLTVSPAGLGQGEVVDLEGNGAVSVWFDITKKVARLEFLAVSQVTLHQSNPFQFLLEPWAGTLPWNYPMRLYQQLSPYLRPGEAIDPVAQQLGQELSVAAQGEVLAFLQKLNLQIQADCLYQVRETGEAWPAGVTWRQRLGSCRDYAVLFMEVCRSQGIAARFVSGYYVGLEPLVGPTPVDLHAWVEVYLPGAGWRGYDPTHGLVVGLSHIALAASSQAQDTMAIVGVVSATGARMDYAVTIEAI
jgi:transglutaminase-like putative cysteine protease